MATRVKSSLDDVLYKQLQYRAVSPLEHRLECLDVLTKVERSRLQRFLSKMSNSLRPLVRIGSMLDLMAVDSKWPSADPTQLDRIRKGLADLQNYRVSRPSDVNFKKKKLPRLDLSFSTTKGDVLWLAGVAGISLEKEESLTCCMDGITAAYVEFTTIFNWIKAGYWCLNTATLKTVSSDWAKDQSKIKSIWIVTEVLYATKFTVTGRKGLFPAVMARASLVGVPGFSVEAGADVGISCISDSSIELKAKRNKQFIVGYRTMRVDYNPDDTLSAMREAQDTGLRGDDDDPQQMNLVLMEEDIFEEDDEGDKIPIPLLTPTEEELNDLRLLAGNCRDSEGSTSTSIES